MITINEIVRDNILQIQFNDIVLNDKSFEIICLKSKNLKFKGTINGKTQSACYFVGDWKKGKYQLNIDNKSFDFEII